MNDHCRRWPPDMASVVEHINQAQQAILFLAFYPGTPSIANWVAQAAKKNKALFVRGCVTNKSASEGFYYELKGMSPPTKQPGVKTPIKQDPSAEALDGKVIPTGWQKEILKAGFAIIHDKVLVIDPFSSKCVVITGSAPSGPTISAASFLSKPGGSRYPLWMPAVRGFGIPYWPIALGLSLGLVGCAQGRTTTSTPTGSGGTTGSGQTAASGGASGQGGGGITAGVGGQGGSVGSGGIAGGGSVASGGAPGSGGTTSASGGAGGSGGVPASGGSARADAAADVPPDVSIDTGPPPIVYALPAPDQNRNQFFIPGCQSGVATSPGGGNCTPAQNACEGTKQGAQVQFLCPRFMLFSDEMEQAALDDGFTNLNYAVVGHDPDTGGIDGDVTVSCCQCYQLIFSLPENVAQVNGGGASAIPIPPALVVQSFNTAAGGGKNFDLFMGAGGFGAFNACDPKASMTSPSGKYFYTQFPAEGEPGSGGVNAATQLASCSSKNLVTTATLSSSACQSAVTTACSKFASSSTSVTSESIRSCAKSNDPNSYYHMNWKIYAKRVECPTHLTEVTGCKLAPQSLPAVNPAVTTPEQAAADSSFKSGYSTTTMQDCCMPTCAWQNNTKGQGLSMVGNYNSFYSCDQSGGPVTEPK